MQKINVKGQLFQELEWKRTDDTTDGDCCTQFSFKWEHHNAGATETAAGWRSSSSSSVGSGGVSIALAFRTCNPSKQAAGGRRRQRASCCVIGGHLSPPYISPPEITIADICPVIRVFARARRYASAVLAMARRLSVSVCHKSELYRNG